MIATPTLVHDMYSTAQYCHTQKIYFNWPNFFRKYTLIYPKYTFPFKGRFSLGDTAFAIAESWMLYCRAISKATVWPRPKPDVDIQRPIMRSCRKFRGVGQAQTPRKQQAGQSCLQGSGQGLQRGPRHKGPHSAHMPPAADVPWKVFLLDEEKHTAAFINYGSWFYQSLGVCSHFSPLYWGEGSAVSECEVSIDFWQKFRPI